MRNQRLVFLITLFLLISITSPLIVHGQDQPLSLGDRRDQSRFGFHFDINADHGRLQTEQDIGFEEKMTDWITLWGGGMRIGMRWRSIRQFSFYLDGHFSIRSGNTILSYENSSLIQPEGEGITEHEHQFNAFLGGIYGGISIPLFRNSRNNTTFMAPRVIALLFELGFHALVITHEWEGEIQGQEGMTISYDTDPYQSDYGLFSFGIGPMIYFRNYLGVYIKAIAGVFPISTVVESSNPDEVGDTTYGYLHRIVLGFQVRL